MPTNRKRTLRMNKNRTMRSITQVYREELRAKDFLGELNEGELLLAKKIDVYCWDGWMKTQIDNTGHSGRFNKSTQKTQKEKL